MIIRSSCFVSRPIAYSEDGREVIVLPKLLKTKGEQYFYELNANVPMVVLKMFFGPDVAVLKEGEGFEEDTEEKLRRLEQAKFDLEVLELELENSSSLRERLKTCMTDILYDLQVQDYSSAVESIMRLIEALEKHNIFTIFYRWQEARQILNP